MRLEAELERNSQLQGYRSLLKRPSYEATTRSIRHLCSRIQTELPRELRDMIYGYLYLGLDYEKDQECTRPDELRAVNSPKHPLCITKIDSLRAGDEFVHEYGETYFRLHTFRVFPEFIDSLLQFLGSTHPYFGLTPAMYTGTLEIRTYAAYQYRAWDRVTPVMVPSETSSKLAYDPVLQALEKALNSLPRLGHARVVVDAILSTPFTIYAWGLDIVAWLSDNSRKLWHLEERGCRISFLLLSKHYKREFGLHSATDYESYAEQLCAWGTEVETYYRTWERTPEGGLK
ncbi:hypothetical protein K458DRAFT_408432 [Lentithecium fluviatile CBS 122367]|uniref:Uncharacterized protein n=1 Tax=Lentithecium fluviatile CBS 122367 TaxID=1168545 RepID=A0A6G1ILR3_9PLEO|nr:hypothetical protein K458DRAFT_408432 [Lentithecium fluviatile CBS 122367]